MLKASNGLRSKLIVSWSFPIWCHVAMLFSDQCIKKDSLCDIISLGVQLTLQDIVENSKHHGTFLYFHLNCIAVFSRNFNLVSPLNKSSIAVFSKSQHYIRILTLGSRKQFYMHQKFSINSSAFDITLQLVLQ